MLRLQIFKTVSILTTLALLIFFSSYTLAQSENVISLKQIRFDKACGPRCLWALMQIALEGLLYVYIVLGERVSFAQFLGNLGW